MSQTPLDDWGVEDTLQWVKEAAGLPGLAAELAASLSPVGGCGGALTFHIPMQPHVDLVRYAGGV